MSGLPSQALRYYAPAPALGPYLTNLFAWTGEYAAFDSWMPAIESQILVRLDGQVTIRFRDTGATVVDRPMLVGPMRGTMHIRTTNDFTAVGAGLTARGYLRLIAAPVGRLDDRATDLAAVLGPGAIAELVDALRAMPSHEHRVRRLEGWLWRRLMAATLCDRRAAAFDDWLAGGAPVTLAALHARLDLSGRHVERLARDLMGLGPKGLAMRQRALRAAQRIAGGAASASAVGYADQSHMIRDFGRFIGVTPAQLAQVAIQRHVFEEPERAGAALAHVRRDACA